MDGQALLSSPIVGRLGWTLLHSLWEGSAVCAGSMAVLRLLQNAPAAGRYVAACVGMLLMAVLPAATFFMLPAGAATSGGARQSGYAAVAVQNAVARTDTGNAAVRAVGAPAIATTPAAPVVSAWPDTVSPPTAESAPVKSWRWLDARLPYAVILWLAGVLLLSGWRLGGWIHLQRLRVVGASPVSVEIHDAMSRMAARLGIARMVRLAASTRMEVPVVFGFFKPVILFPPALLAGLSTQQLEAILAHELAHVRRHDYLALLVQTGVETLLFYHPGVWRLSRLIGLEREQCCDDIAAKASGGGRTYAGVLVAIESIRVAGPALAASGSGASEMMLRIGRLIGVDVPARPQRLHTAIAAVLAILALLVSMTYTAKGQADAAGAVIVIVKDNAGQPVNHVLIHARGANIDTSEQTDGRGMARVQVGTEPRDDLTITASADSFATARIHWTSTLQQAAPSGTMEVLLEKTAAIGGQVVDGEGKPLGGAQVMIAASKKYPNGAQTLGAPETVTADAEGRWEYDKLPASVDQVQLGDYHRDSINDHGLFNLTPFKDISALHARTAQLILPRGTRVEGIVKGPDGKAIATARIEVGESRVSSNVVPPINVNADGTFALGLQRGNVVLTIKAAGFAPDLERVTAGTPPLKLVVSLEPAHTITGTVVNPDGKPVAGANVYSDTWRKAETLGFSATTNAAGQWQWEDAPGDEVSLGVFDPGFAEISATVRTDAENMIKLIPLTILRGSVVDAATGTPISGYMAKDGVAWGGGRGVTWGANARYKPGEKPGTFEAAFSVQRYPAVVLRVDAAGYDSADSPVLGMDGRTTDFVFKMRKAAPLEGTLLSAEGKSLAGATVALVGAGQTIYFDESARFNMPADFSATTDSEGRFQFPPQQTAYRLVVLHKDGARVEADAEFERTHTVQLQKWARVEGLARIGDKPAAGAHIGARVIAFQESKGPGHSLIVGTVGTTSDATGKFVLEHIYPGEVEISNTLKPGSSGPVRHIKLFGGETFHLNIGGTGRAVVGKLNATSDEFKSLATSVVLSNYVPPSYVPPVEVMEMSQADANLWRQNWAASEEGRQMQAASKAAAADARSYRVAVQTDGTFRIDDVEAGNYELNVAWLKTGSIPDSAVQPAGAIVAEARKEVRVPAPADGAGAVAIDAGVFTPAPNRPLVTGESLPDLALVTLDGKVVHLSDYRGKILLIVPWNVYFRDYLPPVQIGELYAAHKDDGKLAILGITSSREAARDYVQARNIPWPTAASNGTLIADAWFPFSGEVRCGLVGADGNLISASVKPEEIKAAVEKALGQ